MKEIRYRSRFALPAAESDYVCALAKLLNLSPDQALQFLVRLFASDDPEFARAVWAQARKDGRGPWRPPDR